MATAERRNPVGGGSLTHDEAAALIEIILKNTSTSAPAPLVLVPDSPMSLTDLFPVAVLAGV